MNTVRVVVGPKTIQLAREVDCVPKERAIEELTSDRSDQSLNERMRYGRVGVRLDSLDLRHA